MPSSPGSIGKRPEFKQSRSAGWSWPRLVPIHEQQSRLSQASQSSASPSLRDHNKQEEPPSPMIASIISKLNTEEDAPRSPVPSAAGRSPTAGESVTEAVNHPPYEHTHNNLPSMAASDEEERGAAISTSSSVEAVAEKRLSGPELGSVEALDEKRLPRSKSPSSELGSVEAVDEKRLPRSKSPSSELGSVEAVTEKRLRGSECGSGENMAEKSPPGSERGSGEDVADMSASASEHGLVEQTANQGDTEVPIGYESIITDVPLNEETPTTPPATTIPPVMDRISGPSNSVPYYATPKIMVHKPSQSSEAENPASRTIDEILANERQSLHQERNSEIPHSTPDGNLVDETPMQSMALRPIAWQAPKDQKLPKRKLYLRKVRNAAARKTILKATLGRQLAIPTKQMLRLLANGENLTVPDIPKNDVEAATMLVPQNAVGSVTGAVLLPQGVAGAVPNK